jgi:hypothetical protein
VSTFGTLQRIGVEATGTYGAGLLRYMQQAGIEVLEVTTRRTNCGNVAQNDTHAARQDTGSVAARLDRLPQRGIGLQDHLKSLGRRYLELHDEIAAQHAPFLAVKQMRGLNQPTARSR